MNAPFDSERAKKMWGDLRRRTDTVIEKVKPAVDKTQTAVTSGVHKMMGSGEYREKALDVNRRLAVAVVSLEDAIARRDEEITRLKARIAELEDGQRRV
ncbi:MAG: hypothetical protein FJW53_06610 [Actinobacteria bacterium]|nr:hypothetical protein [Actinomycetota bacterium]